MSLALYRKYRSKSLNEIVGQGHVTDLLSKAITAGRISHAYLLTGPRGVGKTSVARILAHEINGLPYNDDSTHLDIIEIDAASNNGVEDVRDLREKVQIAPVSAAKKVYIIDEVHMLSKAAFNALLKTLEEPPEHIVFILATTDVEKLPATIVSRTQRYSFRSISDADAVGHLRDIATAENITIDDDALVTIARRGDGSFRDSISLLDQLANIADDTTGITAELVEASLGLASQSLVEKVLAAVDAHDVEQIAKLLETSAADGVSPTTLTQQLTYTLRTTVASKPQYLTLLDRLLDVSRSSQPQLKLLTVLGSAALENKPAKTAALSAPVRHVTGTIEELAQKATDPKPTESIQPVESIIIEKATGDFDWDKLIEHTRKNYVALYSVLCKCGHEREETVLTLFTKSAFYKKKLDDPKYSTHLYESLRAICGDELTIVTIPSAAPPKDSQAAAVAAIMGGGEEVAI